MPVFAEEASIEIVSMRGGARRRRSCRRPPLELFAEDNAGPEWQASTSAGEVPFQSYHHLFSYSFFDTT